MSRENEKSNVGMDNQRTAISVCTIAFLPLLFKERDKEGKVETQVGGRGVRCRWGMHAPCTQGPAAQRVGSIPTAECSLGSTRHGESAPLVPVRAGSVSYFALQLFDGSSRTSKTCSAK